MEQNTTPQPVAQPVQAQMPVQPAQPASPQPAQPVPLQAAPPQMAQQQSAPAQSVQPMYASFLQRVGASLIDTVIVFIVQFVISFAMIAMLGSNTSSQAVSQLLAMIVGFAYFIYFTFKDGATVGKKILKIKVVRADGQKLTILGVILRETVGKFASSIVLGLGYLWVIWDSKKQGWHDKIAQTIVVKAA